VNLHVGTAGWGNPPAKRPERNSSETHLKFYSRHFDCVEINSSFHRRHRQSTYARWRDEVPERFRFSIKMPRSITHESRLTRCAAEVAEFYEDAMALQPKLGVVLVQLPPALEFDSDTVRAFFASVPRIDRVTVACEPRHPSWFTREADNELRDAQVSRVAADPARCAGADGPGGSTRLAYYRWHGAPHIYYSKYSKTRLAAFADSVANTDAVESWCIFDNTARHEAWDDAQNFMAAAATAGKAPRGL
jgi:uncharacterized protein YecE (DUF72 family)